MICQIFDSAKESVSFPAERGERILFAGLRAGFGLPYECATGNCGSCRASIQSGSVRSVWKDAPANKKLRPKNILMCQTACESDVTLNIAGKVKEFRTAPKHFAGTITNWEMLTPEIGELSVRTEKPMRFLAGQFCLLEFPEIEGPRAYSMSCRPSEADKLTFIIRNTGSGALSQQLFGQNVLQREIKIFGPLGSATFEFSEQRPFVAIAGGSGIAGMLSIIDDAIAQGHFTNHNSQLIFGLRRPDTSYLLDRLSTAVKESEGGFKTTVVFSECQESPSYEHFDVGVGFVHEATRAVMKAVHPSTLFYVAGPSAMVDATIRMLVVEHRISAKDIRYDRFS